MKNKDILNKTLKSKTDKEIAKELIQRKDLKDNDFFDGYDEAFVLPDGTWCWTECEAIEKTINWLNEDV